MEEYKRYRCPGCNRAHAAIPLEEVEHQIVQANEFLVSEGELPTVSLATYLRCCDCGTETTQFVAATAEEGFFLATLQCVVVPGAFELVAATQSVTALKGMVRKPTSPVSIAAMNIDTKIRHTTPAGGNIFLDLGFPPEEAAALQAESKRIISEKKMACPACSKAMEREESRTERIEYDGEAMTVEGLAGWFCPSCREAVLDDESARRYGEAGDTLLAQSRERRQAGRNL